MMLCSALNEINTPEVAIHAVEDKIEYINTYYQAPFKYMHAPTDLPHFFKYAACLFCAKVLTSFLSKKSAGKKTAKIAVEVALTGHLLASRRYTNDVPNIIECLTNTGINPFMRSGKGTLTLATIPQEYRNK